jgi:hypothetical protein
MGLTDTNSDESSEADNYCDNDDDSPPPEVSSIMSPMKRVGTQSILDESGDREMMSWNSANSKAIVVSARALEEINGERVVKSTPKEDVFDKDFGSKELDASAEEDDGKI